MFRKLLITAAAALSLGSIMASEASAWSIGSMSRPHRFRSEMAPLAFQLFCLQNPNDCQRSRRDVVRYTPGVVSLLNSVNSAVNRSIRPTRERTDVWSISTRSGDCDDYVMTKRHRLIAAGLPASALRVAVVRTPRGEGHAILIVKTTAGELALDNLRKTIVRRNQTGYRFISVASANPYRWN
jgi:predicted transglutaminase-like cysteine proteinase